MTYNIYCLNPLLQAAEKQIFRISLGKTISQQQLWYNAWTSGDSEGQQQLELYKQEVSKYLSFCECMLLLYRLCAQFGDSWCETYNQQAQQNALRCLGLEPCLWRPEGWVPDAPGEGTGPGASKSTPVPTQRYQGAGARLFSLGCGGRARAWHWETSPQEQRWGGAWSTQGCIGSLPAWVA